MPKTIHVCLDIRGALRHSNFRGFQHDDGRPMTRYEAKEALMDELAKGRRVLPMVPLDECPGFDYQTGCPGHPTSDSPGLSPGHPSNSTPSVTDGEAGAQR